MTAGWGGSCRTPALNPPRSLLVLAHVGALREDQQTVSTCTSQSPAWLDIFSTLLYLSSVREKALTRLAKPIAAKARLGDAAMLPKPDRSLPLRAAVPSPIGRAM